MAARLFGHIRLTHALIIAVVMILDQATKYWMRVHVVPGRLDQIELLPVLNLVHVWNPGISFSMFASGEAYMPWILAAVALAVSAAMLAWLRAGADRVTGWALSTIVGGALGNVIDRVVFGKVFDFVDAHYAGYHFPAFNVADAAISLGAVLLIFKMLFGSTTTDSAKAPKS